MSLYIKHRPTDFEQFIGNKSVVNSLKTILERDDKPHVLLFTGESGCGKTTLARITANKLGCDESDLIEINSANNRGIDTAREIINNMRFKPLNGKIRCYIMDECFAKDTKIRTNKGNINIENININDSIYNINGLSKVEYVFKNKVDLNRIIRINLSDDSTMFCSKEHLFLTDKGWRKAINLTKKDLIFKFNYSIMTDNTIQRSFKNDKKLSFLWESIQNKKQKAKTLFHLLWSKIQKKIIGNKLRILWERNVSRKKGKIYKKILQSKLCFKISSKIASCDRNKQIARKNKKIKKSIKKIQKRESRKRQENKIDAFTENEKKQSYEQSKNKRKNVANKENKWNIKCLFRKTWWKWAIYKVSNFISYYFGLAYGSSSFIRRQNKKLSNKLQSRYRECKFKIRNRDRWERTSDEKEYIKRYKKRKQIERIRVENIEVYKRGSNDKSFSSIISNKERNKGYVTFYDLQIKGHPSYFANNILVHNCHRWTRDFMEAMLKPLEDTPNHVYFLLCTTEPEKLLKTIRNRCTEFYVQKLPSNRIARLLKQISRKENVTLSDDILNEIVIESEGSPRQALVILDKIRDLKEDEILEAIQSAKIEEKQIIDLCRALIKKETWTVIAKIIKGIESEPEKVRRAVLGYMSSVLLNGENNMAALCLDCFKDNFYDSGKAGLVNACYEVIIG
jgi:DNA polymerase III gamma/tau subunit